MLLKLYRRWKAYGEKLSLSNYICNIFLILMFCAAIGSMIGNVLTGFPLIVNVKWVLAIAICLLGFRLIYRNCFVEVFKFFVFCSALTISVQSAWYYGGRENTITILYLVMLQVEAFLIFETRGFKWIFAVASTVTCVFLLSISRYFPYLYEQGRPPDVLADTILQITIVFSVMMISIAIYTKRYRVQHEQLIRANAALEKLASIDSLSGIYNRRKILEMLELCFRRRRFHSMYIIMFDIDKFKGINDSYGHQVGDAAIRHIAEHSRRVIGNQGSIGRYGGDEFIICLTDLTDAEVSYKAKQLSDVPRFKGIELHISGGISKLNRETTVEALITRADDLLIFAKNQGRNQIRLWNEEINPTNADTETEQSSRKQTWLQQ